MYRDVVQWSKIRHRILVKGRLASARLLRDRHQHEIPSDKMLDHRTSAASTARGAIGIQG